MVIQKFLISFFLLIYGSSICLVKAKTYKDEELPIVVKSIQNWSADYPTVTNNWNGMMLKDIDGNLPPILSIITSINGKSTKGMGIEDFNEILMDDGNSVLEYQTLIKGNVIEDKCSIQYYTKLYWPEGITLDYPEAFSENVSVKSDPGTQFFKYHTYSFPSDSTITHDDIALYETVGRALRSRGLVKADNDSPDIVLILSLGKDQLGKPTKILSILDGEQLRKDISQVVWSMEVKEVDLSPSGLTVLREEIYNCCANYPFEIPVFCHQIKTLGIGFADEVAYNNGQVLCVLNNTDAYKKGLRGGDTIIKGYTGGMYAFTIYFPRVYWFKAGHPFKKTKVLFGWLMGIVPVPWYFFKTPELYLSRDMSSFGPGIARYIVKGKDGQERKIDAPFKPHTFHFKYMR